MQRILFLLLACCLMVPSDLFAQKKKAKTSHSKTASSSSKKKKAKASASKKKGKGKKQKAAPAVPLPPLQSVGDFDKVNFLRGNGKNVDPEMIEHPEALSGLDAFIYSCISQALFPVARSLPQKTARSFTRKILATSPTIIPNR
jgi:hypothetical protein